MLVDLTVLPLRGGRHISDEVAEVIKLINATGYQVTPFGTCIEGEWETVIPLVQRCHNVVRSMSSHVVTVIKIDDEFGKENQLTGNITTIERRIDHAVGKTSRLLTPDRAPAGNQGRL